MTLLIFGKTGQVGKELQLLSQTATVALGRDSVDLLNPTACAAVIRSHSPNAVINAAAFTAVDRAEEEEEMATRINGDAPAIMASACAELDIPFIHISTDYVFDGTGLQPKHTTDVTSPLNAYGRSKLKGEERIRSAGGRYAILRTSWVFSTHNTNFVKTILHLSETQDCLNIVCDQIGGPTPAHSIATACLSIADQLMQDASKSGIYHLSGTPDTSWYNFAREIFFQTQRTVRLNPICTLDSPAFVVRPLNSRLDCQKIEQVFGVVRPNWRVALKSVLKELEHHGKT